MSQPRSGERSNKEGDLLGRRWWRVILALGLVSGVALTVIAMMWRQDGDAEAALTRVEAKVRTEFADVRHIAPDAVARLAESRRDVVVLDVRELEEYAVSHLAGALHVDPQITPEQLMAQYGDQVRGKDVVVYCSVGVRSSKLARLIEASLSGAGARAVYNLEGGIFRWHGERRPLVAGGAATDLVHPYDGYWGRLVQRQDRISRLPAPRSPPAGGGNG